MMQENTDNIKGLPYIYKGVKIYPVRMKDYYKFHNYVNCLLLEKNKSQDIKVIKMSYLKFIFISSAYGIQTKLKEYDFFSQLNELLSIIFREQQFNISFQELGNQEFALYINVNISEDKTYEQNIKINESDFNEIRKIILMQNQIVIPEFMNNEMEQALKEAKEFMNKRNKEKSPTLEDRMVSYKCEMKKDYDYIDNLTIYQFNKELERLAIIKHFEVYTYPILKGGKSEDIIDWLCHIEDKGVYDEVIMSDEDFKKLTSDKDIFKNK